MRVCIIGPAPPLRGGVAAHTQGLHAALCRSGHQVRVIGYRRLYPATLFPGTSEREAVAPLGEELLDTLSPLSWFKARGLLARAQADLLVVQWWHPLATAALTVALTALEVPKVVICHNLVPHEWFPLARPMARSIVNAATAVVCHSRAVARQVLRANARVAVEVCPMPLLAEPVAAVGEAAELRSRLGLDTAGPVALFLGLVREYKGIDLLLDAWSRARLPGGSRLVIAGESYLGKGVLAAMVRSGVADDSVIVDDRYLAQRELWQFLAIADVLVLPYRRASQSGLVPLARAAGVRVVVSDAGGLAEASNHGRLAATVFASGERGALILALEEALGGEPGCPRLADSAQVGSAGRCYRDSWQPLSSMLERVARGRRPALS